MAGIAKAVDVAVVGGGTVGLTLALRLARTGRLSVALVEAGNKAKSLSEVGSLPTPDLRTFAITPASGEVLDSVGAWDRLLEGTSHSAAFTDMQVWESVGGGYMRFSAQDAGVQELGHVLENRALSAALTDTADDLDDDNLDIMYGMRVGRLDRPSSSSSASSSASSSSSSSSSPHQCQLHLSDRDGNDSVLSAKLVVGADGANSVVRRMADMGTWGWDYASRAVVATVETDGGHSTAWQRFLPDGPIAILPLAGNRSSMIWSTTPDHARALEKMDGDEFVAAATEALTAPCAADTSLTATPLFLQPLSLLSSSLSTVFDSVSSRYQPFHAPPTLTSVVGPRGSFPLKLSHATGYVQPGVALVGDAAHTTHPLAGQGLNLGIADADALADVLNRSLDAGYDVGALTPLKEYESARKIRNVAMINGLDVVKRLFSGGEPDALSMLRRVGLSGINALEPVKSAFVQVAMGRV